MRGRSIGTRVLHANWTGGGLWLWAEHEPASAPSARSPGTDDQAPIHPWADDVGSLRELLHQGGLEVDAAREGAVTLRLPTVGTEPVPSPSLAHAEGRVAHARPAGEGQSAARLASWAVPAIRIPPGQAPALLERVEEAAAAPGSTNGNGRLAHLVPGASVRFFAAASRVARWLLCQQRFVPSVESDTGGVLTGRWAPWLGDQAAAERLASLVAGMPPVARSADDMFAHDGAAIAQDFLLRVVDAWSRAALEKEGMAEAIEGRDAAASGEVAWLTGLLGASDQVLVDESRRVPVAKTVRRWLANLLDRGAGGSWRLCLRLNEPLFLGALRDLEEPDEKIVWILSFHLQSVENATVIIDAEDVWALHADSASVGGRRVDRPQDLVLTELGRAARLYPRLERALSESEPVSVELNTRQAYEFLREVRPLLVEQGFGVVAPDWWESPAARVGARLRLAPPQPGAGRGASGRPSSVAPPRLGLRSIVGYQWQLAVGDTPLSLEEFQKLAAKRAPLVRIDGRWVEVRPEDVQAAALFIRANPGGETTVGEALRIAFRTELAQTGLPIMGIDASGWVADLLEGAAGGAERISMLATPSAFHGVLRPYQSRGLSWLAFLDALGLGPCLADDMGLGKTIQLLALLVHEREQAARARDAAGATEIGPTLLVVPMSIVANWVREAARFSPTLRVLVHHGSDRAAGDDFVRRALGSDLVITTYALVHRDRALLELVPWFRVVLDEAQNVKNPSAKQSQAVRALEAPRRTALTGTPLENRLSELWSIMDFCNPGLLGSLGEFRRTFAVPIERYRDKEKASRLRSLVRPFVLRRLKTDPSVIADLPPKVETKQFCRLTSEQASLYETCVKQMLGEVEGAEGIRRRGIVLTALVRLKQICNHPAQLPAEEKGLRDPAAALDPARSGKCIRILELLDEVIAEGDQALVFTQFRVMAEMLAAMLRHRLDREVLLLHGGTPSAERQEIIDLFQRPDRVAPVLVLSLKAGGVGLNLTAASHVFHFDRWWNPAVENQATDRAFRIGQTRTVNVHKFVVSGTLEERIDQMIESKTALAEDVIGSGEAWLTELSTAALRDILTLRPDAVEEE